MNKENEELNEDVEEDIDLELDEEEVEDKVEIKKPTETLEARRSRLTRQLEQTNKKLGVTEEKEVKQYTKS